MLRIAFHVYSIVLLSLLLLQPAHAKPVQAFGQKIEVLSLSPVVSQDKVRPGDSFKLGIQITMFDDWHINSNQPSEEYLIATVLELDENEAFTYNEIHYPAGEMVRFEFSETPLSVYEDNTLIWVDVVAASGLTPGDQLLKGALSYQACNNSACLAPTAEAFELAIEVVDKTEPASSVNEDIFNTVAVELAELQGQRQSNENEIDRLMQGSGLFLTLVFIFIGGLALNLTPCVYPIIPITISFFVGQASGKISRSFMLALTYVFGMSVTYSILGLVAAMTGGLLGASLQNPLVLIVIAAIFLIFAASMFGAFEIQVPAFLNRMAGGSKQGYFGSLFMGLTVGIVAAPCIGPFVLSLLTYVAAKGDPFTGFILFFVLSMGLGLPYLFLGTFSGSIQNLPRSGEWMIWVKKVFGFIMIAMAVYFVSTLIPEILYVSLLTGVLVAGGLAVGFFDKSKASFSWFSRLKLLAGMLLIIMGIWTAYGAWRSANAPSVSWQPYSQELVAAAVTEQKPVLIDFYADWCIPCKQLDKTLFSDENVVATSERFMTLKADLTQEKSEQTKALRQKYRVLGVPTIILIDTQGREYLRFTDELVHTTPDSFVKVLEGIFEIDR